jgi:alkylated DNA repair dioxygenase AlkB
MALASRQTSLFGGGAPAIVPDFRGARRTDLDATAWVEHVPSWVAGHEALLEALVSTTRWQSVRREMYERTVDVPRLVASLPDDGPGHPLLEQVRLALSQRYGTVFAHVSLAFYRDGNDSVAWHGDYVARDSHEDALVASVSLGEPRRLLLRRRKGPGAAAASSRSVAFSLGWGDLFVMGGACQRTWEHAVPKVSRAEPRLAVMFRPTWYRRIAP